MKPSSQKKNERVWLLAGVTLAALYLAREIAIVGGGIAIGLGMFVGIRLLFNYAPTLEKALFSFGGMFDLGISFGLPFVIGKLLGQTSGTLFVATLVCGLLFSFSIATHRLGGPVNAASKSTSLIVRDTMSQFETWKEGYERGKRDQVGLRGSGVDRGPGRRGERPQGEEEAGPGHRWRGRVIDMPRSDYEVK